MLLCGDEIVKSNALEEAAQLSEVLGCPAFQSTISYGAHFLSERPCFVGAPGPRPEAGARYADALRHHDRARLRRAAHVGVERDRSEARSPAHRPGRPRRLGDRQELSGGVRGEGRRARDDQGADPGAEAERAARRWPSAPRRASPRCRRRTGRRSARRPIAGANKLCERKADPRRLDDASPRRGDAEGRHPGERGHHLGAARQQPVRLSATAMPCTATPRAASAGRCRRRSACSSRIRTGRSPASPATVRRCIRCRRCGPRRTRSCRSPTSSATTAATASSSSG